MPASGGGGGGGGGGGDDDRLELPCSLTDDAKAPSATSALTL